jgi:hypothetical protein
MDQNAKSQAVERIKEAQNVLITVSANPSVDQLAAAIGFTLLLNKLDKHATAVFSGAVPSTLEFLKPEDTLEQTTDSLRDFIISLDKSKADKLRYKVEDEVVRIFITPYRTKLSENDLIFSQGDFNVDVVVALGVDNKEHIDQAIAAHGRILHDATVIGVMAGNDPVDVGSINWQDANASSLSEMLMSISESLKSGIVDNQIATAFLTGIVASTDRFKNEKTTPKAMTMSAQLMAAGANQQLIAEELTQPEVVPEEPEQEEQAEQTEDTVDEDGVLSLHHSNVEDEDKPEDVEDHHVHIDDTGEFSNAEQLREAVEQVQEHKYTFGSHEKTIQPIEDTQTEELQEQVHEEVVEQEPEQEVVDTPLPGEEIHPGDTSEQPLGGDEESELSLPAPEELAELPKITHERWGKDVSYLDHPPSTEQPADEFSAQAEEELPSIEQAGEQNYSKYVGEPPVLGSPLRADTDEDNQISIDPLASIPQAGPLGGADAPTNESPLLSTQHDAESPRAIEVPTTESTQLASDGETDISGIPLGPVVTDDSTLSEIESSVESFENAIPNGNSITDAQEDARRAVMDAINQGGPSPFPTPNENLGAQFVPLDTEPQVVEPATLQSDPNAVQSPDSPPSVPPPLMPPFPIPGIEVIEPTDTTNQQ